jgi:nitroimidazol reductase NimA-like FMN-containing flavoprotein (pyridoxamine 5'-phosphate oxidase superfamily)
MSTPRPRFRPAPPRANADRAAVHGILDAGWMAHVGFALRGQPYVTPMLYVRDGDELLLHGNLGAPLLSLLGRGAGTPACVSVTLIDGLVLARAHLRHGLNYRSVIAFGRAGVLTDPGEKAAALACLVDNLVPGRAGEARPADPQELAGTAVLRFVIEDASAKVRSGPPTDAITDLDSSCWAGEVPVRTSFDLARPAPDLAIGRPLPNSLRRLLADELALSA